MYEPLLAAILLFVYIHACTNYVCTGCINVRNTATPNGIQVPVLQLMESGSRLRGASEVGSRASFCEVDDELSRFIDQAMF
jgi:hypothetical protein